MRLSLANTLFPITEVDIQNVRNLFGKTGQDIRKDCEVIQTWMAQQMHFPDDYDPIRVERILLRNKFRVERTKEKLENYYTTKAAQIDFLKRMDTSEDVMIKCMSSIVYVPLPKLFNKTERIFILRFTGNENDYNFDLNSLLAFAMLELESIHDYATGLRMIVDYKGFSMTHFKTININTLSKIFEMYQESLSGRFIGVEYINGPSFLGMLLDILRVAIPEKLYKKITVHSNLDSLKASIPEEYLPSDYGGKLRSTDSIYVDVRKFLEENNDYIMERVNKIADESKRIGSLKKNEMFGVQEECFSSVFYKRNYSETNEILIKMQPTKQQ